MLPIAYMLPTSDRRPISLTRTCAPFSMTWSSLSVHCHGVAFGSNLISDEMSYWDRLVLARAFHDILIWAYLSRDEEIQRSCLAMETSVVDSSDNSINLGIISILAHRCTRLARVPVMTGILTVSFLNGLHTTALYLTVNSAKPLPGIMRPSETSKVSMTEMM